MKAKQTITISIVLVVVAGATIFAVWANSRNKKTPDGQKPAQNQNVNATNSVPSMPKEAMPSLQPPIDTKVPAVFPADFPMETGAKVLQNFESANPKTGEKNYNKVFTTAKSVDANMELYKNYLTSHGWTIVRTEEQSSYKGMYASKDDYRMTVFMVRNEKENQETVSVNLTYPNK